MPDGWEVQYGLDPLSNDADSDFDGDGTTNALEYNLATDPGDANSQPILYNYEYDDNGNLEHMHQP